MPIFVDGGVRRLTQAEFSEVAYRVMETVFEVHNDMGRFFKEPIYKRELAARIADARPEVQIDVRFEDFRKEYFMDLLVSDGAVFELKAVEQITDRHRAQLLNYLLLAELAHGKLINLRPEQVDHAFVNTTLRRVDRTAFVLYDQEWKERDGLKHLLLALLRDWGTGLDLALYHDALTHFLGGKEQVITEIEVRVGDRHVGWQKVRLAAPDAAFRVTAINETGRRQFEVHALRFLWNTSLQFIHWINVTNGAVTLQTIQRGK